MHVSNVQLIEPRTSPTGATTIATFDLEVSGILCRQLAFVTTPQGNDLIWSSSKCAGGPAVQISKKAREEIAPKVRAQFERTARILSSVS